MIKKSAIVDEDTTSDVPQVGTSNTKLSKMGKLKARKAAAKASMAQKKKMAQDKGRLMKGKAMGRVHDNGSEVDQVNILMHFYETIGTSISTNDGQHLQYACTVCLLSNTCVTLQWLI